MAEALTEIKYTIKDIDTAAAQCWRAIKGHRILAFSGGLGAGKTTFIRALCRYLGVEDAVSSPTFALINQYQFLQNGQLRVIYHMDWYRLRDAEEAINAGMEDCLLQPEAICLVEWPEQAPEILPSPYVYITIEHEGDNERKLILEIK